MFLSLWFRNLLLSRRRFSRGYLYDALANPIPRVWVGNGARLAMPGFIETFGITHIINCAEDEACPSQIRDAFTDRYTCIGAEDRLDVHLFHTWYPQFREALDRYLRDPLCRGVYVHCQAGINRSAFLAAAYAIKTYRIPFPACVTRMVTQRPCIMTNQSFQTQLLDFIKKQE